MNEPMNDVDERIRAALHAAVDGMQEHDLRPASPPQHVSRRRLAIRWGAPALAAAAVVAVVLTSIEVSSGPQARHAVPPAASASSKPTPSTTSAPTSVAKTPKPTPTDHPTTKTPPPEATLVGYEPLWPFGTIAQARAWEAANRQGGQASWHLDARQTALHFAQGYLKFSDITKVTSAQFTVKDARIGVGYTGPNGQPHTAAVLHLLRFSDNVTDTSAPWEVVGATTADFSITSPADGTEGSVPGSLHVAGRITGVDENVTVALRSLDGGVNTADPIPAGGQNSRWALAVPFDLHGAVAVVASTGGHVTAHERFAVVGINVS